MTKINLDNVPLKPGVYLWKDKYGTVIYVGKAKKLKDRMGQYFKGMLNSYKTAKMVAEIDSFDYVITNTDKEALILERNLIEKYSPVFNIKLTDNKRYPYIKVRLTDSLEISLVYRIKNDRDKALFYGPFPTGYNAKKMVNLLNRMTTYKNGLPYKKSDKKYWEEKYLFVKELLTSNSKSLIKNLESQMISAAEKMQFEVAQDLKETIESFNHYKVGQTVEFNSLINTDVIAFVQKDNYLSIAMLFYRQGTLLSKNDFVIEITSSIDESTRQFISQYYSNNFRPDQIISNINVETDIKLIKPQKGDKKKILNNALLNAEDNINLKLQSFIRKEELTIGAMRKLQAILKLENLSHILMIDNSNTNNTDPVSAIVSYRNGIKQKNEYKKYNLINKTRNADVEYMKQGVTRYFSDSDNPVPELFIVDGGIAQINEIKNIIPKSVTLIGLVKNDKHSTSHILTSGNKRIDIDDQTLLNFLIGMQIEVDRFAKMHHSSRRRKTFEGILLTIDGIGKKTELKILEHFKSYAAIYNASIEELEEVVSPALAKKIKEKVSK